MNRRNGGQHLVDAQRTVVLVAGVIALLLVSPVILVVLDTGRSGFAAIGPVLFRSRSVTLMTHTVGLAAIVAVTSALLGICTAWWTERTSVPLRRMWMVLLVLPVAMPDFVMGFAWHSSFPSENPLLGAVIVMTITTFPLVYLPVAAALRRSDPALQEVSQSLGVGPLQTFVRVTIPLITPAILGGCLLSILAVISEYGAFEILRFQTFTTAVFAEFQFDPEGAAALSIPLVLLGLAVLAGEALSPKPVSVATRSVSRSPRPARLGPSAVAVVVGLSSLTIASVGFPVGTLVYWIVKGEKTTLPAATTLGRATVNTIGYSAAGAFVAVVLAIPVAMMTFRRSTATRRTIERSTYLSQTVPGVVVAVSLVFLATRYLFGLYQSSALLVAAYVVLHFPLAYICVRTSVAQASPLLIDVSRSLGKGPVSTFFRVVLPLIGPGLAAGFSLVFLTATTELTATLVLAPIGINTLATQFWAFNREVAYSAAAPYALTLVALAAVPGTLLGLWFDREKRTSPALGASTTLIAPP